VHPGSRRILILLAGQGDFCALLDPIRHPKSEIRTPKEARNPKICLPSAFGLRICFGIRASDFGFGDPKTGSPAK